MGRLVMMRITEEKKQLLGQILKLTNSGNSPKEVGLAIGKSATYVSRTIRDLPKIIAALHAVPEQKTGLRASFSRRY